MSERSNEPKILVRITTVPISLDLLLTGQMSFMSNYGFKVYAVSSAGKEWESIRKREGCETHIINMTRKISPARDLISLFKLVVFIVKCKPHIVHTHTPKAGLLGMLAARFAKVPLRLHTIAGLPLMSESGWKHSLLVLTEKITYWAAHRVLPNSNSIRSYLINNKLIDTSKLGMIGVGSSNGIDLSRYAGASLIPDVLDSIKANISYNAKCTYLICIGRMVNDKGIPELVRAFIEAREKNKKLRLLLLGPLESERSSETLSSVIRDIITSDKDVIHVPWTDKVEYYLHLASVCIHPSHREGLPNVILQAGAMQCPVICSDIPGNIDLVKDGISGMLFKVGNVDSLYDTLCYALQNRSLLDSYALNLHNYVTSNFDRKLYHLALLKYYQKLIGPRN